MSASQYPETTLFMLVSVDGKISSGNSSERDFDKDLPSIKELSGGLKQYYDLEQKTDEVSFNTGKVMEKVGWNEIKSNIKPIPVDFVIVDNKPHLTKQGVLNLLKRTRRLYIVTTNPLHPASEIEDQNLHFMVYKRVINLKIVFAELKKLGIDKITIQSGGEMNASLVHENLIDKLKIVMLPALVGGRTTPTLVDGEAASAKSELFNVKSLELIGLKKLEDSYILLEYKVLKGKP